MQFTSAILALQADGIANRLHKKRLDWGVTWDREGLWLEVRLKAKTDEPSETVLVKELLTKEALCVV